MRVRTKVLVKFLAIFILGLELVFATGSTQWSMVRRLSHSNNSNFELLHSMTEKLKAEPNPEIANQIAKRLSTSLDLKIVNIIIKEIAAGVDLLVPMYFSQVLVTVPDFRVTQAIIDKIAASFDPQTVTRMANLLLKRETNQAEEKIKAILKALPNDGAAVAKILSLLPDISSRSKRQLERAISRAKVLSHKGVNFDGVSNFLLFGSGFRGDLTAVAGDILQIDLVHNLNSTPSDWSFEVEQNTLSYLGSECKEAGVVKLCTLSFQAQSDLRGEFEDNFYINPGSISEWKVPLSINLVK